MNEIIKPFANTLYQEIKDKYPKKYIIETYQNLLNMCEYVKNDCNIEGLELIMIKYLKREK